MKFCFMIFFIFLNIASAYDINQLLDLYRKNNDLSKQTKDESLGYLTVYTRDDLERMQAHNLGDLLNSLRLIRYDENLFGMPDVFHTDPSLYSSPLVKIFVNNHEITSAFAGSGVYLYGNIDLGFVDHVEIYEGSTSTNVNSEPSIVTIKLYSKDPSREVGNNFQAYTGSRGSSHENISNSYVNKDLSYYLYASHTDARRKEYKHNNHTLSRDYKSQHILFTMKYKNIDVDAEILEHKMNPFLSMSMFAIPNKGEINYLLKRIGSDITFLDDNSLKLSISLMRINGYMLLNMDASRWSSSFSALFLNKDKMSTSSTDDVFDTKLEKKNSFGKHNIIFGMEYVYKQLHDVSVYNNGIKDNNTEFEDVKIASAYFQDDYFIDDKQMITLSSKVNAYDSRSNRDSRKFTTLQARVGYIYSSNKSMFKVFASKIEVPTEQYVLTSTPLSKINIVDMKDYMAEYVKKIHKQKIGVSVEYIENKNLKINIAKGDKKYSGNYVTALKYNLDFNAFNNLKSMIYRKKYYNIISRHNEEVHGGFIRLLNTWNKFDVYNEADYYRILNSKTDGVDYSFGLRYKATNSLIFSFKGSNIFSTAAKSKYDYVRIDNFTPKIDSLYYSSMDRFFSIGVEYSF